MNLTRAVAHARHALGRPKILGHVFIRKEYLETMLIEAQRLWEKIDDVIDTGKEMSRRVDDIGKEHIAVKNEIISLYGHDLPAGKVVTFMGRDHKFWINILNENKELKEEINRHEKRICRDRNCRSAKDRAAPTS